MCGIVGFVNYKQDISNYKNILINMNNTLSRRGPDEEGYFIKKHVTLAHKRLIVIDPEGGKQPMGNLGHLGPGCPNFPKSKRKKGTLSLFSLFSPSFSSICLWEKNNSKANVLYTCSCIVCSIIVCRSISSIC